MGRYAALFNPLATDPGTTAPRNASHDTNIPLLFSDSIQLRDRRSITLPGEISSPDRVRSHDD